MAYNILADFFSIITVSTFDMFSVLLVICFLIWEIPRSVKIISEEYTKGVYPEAGRVIDFALLAAGLLAIAYLMMDNNLARVIAFLKTPGITSFFLVVLVVIPVIVFLGFLKRFFARIDGQNSVTVFLVHGFLDLMHTLFFISLTALVLPPIGYLLFGAR